MQSLYEMSNNVSCLLGQHFFSAFMLVLGHLNSKKCVLGAKLVVILTKMSHWGLVSVHLLQNWWIATASKFSLLKKISHQKIGKQKWMEIDSWYLQGRFIRVIQWFFHKMVKVISLTPIEILVSQPLAIEAQYLGNTERRASGAWM